MQLGTRFDAALAYARQAHANQTRKGTRVPYIAHLLAVAATVLEYGGDEDLAIAGLLHDAVEDQGGLPRLADIRDRFGERVADIVLACSDSQATDGGAKPPWRQRKLDYLQHLDAAGGDVLLVSLADKVHNARSILRDLRTAGVGASVWGRFNASAADTIAYYAALADTFRRRLPGQLSDELGEIVGAIAADTGVPVRPLVGIGAG
ncbi:hypothetical protein STAQ_04190 [Allostella sp. ATCC 35155]|nr:hypothetical protein STAQ_04190 [Stella sp. ATCC 35155]